VAVPCDALAVDTKAGNIKVSRLTAVFAAFALAGAGLVGARPASAQTPGGNGLIATTRGGTDLVVMNLDGSGLRVVTTGRDLITPTWSPDGARLAYFAQPSAGNSMRELFLVNVDGTGRSQVTSDQSQDKFTPSWSPDGRRIAFAEGDSLVSLTLDGSAPTLTLATGCPVKPSWSPNGSTIAYYSCNNGDIFSVAADGSSAPTPLTTYSGVDLQPDYSPDGSSIVYLRDDPDGRHMYLMGSDGSNPHILPGGSYPFYPSFSPDGTKVSFNDPPPPSGTWHTYTVDIDGAHLQQLDSDDTVGDFYTAWQPLVTAPSVPGSLAATMTDGGTFTTGSSASPAVPVQTSITAPAGLSGSLSVTPRPTTTTPSSGLSLFGTELVLEGPAATPSAPYTVSFTVDTSMLGGIAPADVQVLRNVTPLSGCTSPVAAIPVPCIVSRGFAPDGSGDALVTVRTSHFSTWNLGRLSYALNGPLQPVDASPTVNTAKAGAAIPVKFKLGGDRGLNVLAAGYPRSAAITCGSAGTDEVETTLTAAASALTYDAATQQYSYVWKTSTSQRGCRDLVLRFRDGSTLRMLFNLR
jgi:hypothetical protein